MLLTMIHGQAYRNITRNNITERHLYPSSEDAPNRYVRTSHGNLHQYPVIIGHNIWPHVFPFYSINSFLIFQLNNHWNDNLHGTSEAGTTTPSGAPKFTSGFRGVRVTRSLVLYVCFVDRCLSFCAFSFGHCVICSSVFCPLCCLFFCLLTIVLSVLLSFDHCVVCSSSIYGFWLPLWYLQTLLTYKYSVV